MKNFLITLLVLVSLFSVSGKASAGIIFCPFLAGAPQPEIQKSQIKIQGIAMTDDKPLPIGTSINYFTKLTNNSCSGGTRGSFTINKANGQYGPINVSVPTGTSYLNLIIASIPQDYLAGRIIDSNQSLNFTITPEMANTTITQDLSFKAKLIIPPPPPPPPPAPPLYPLIGNTPPPIIQTSTIESCRALNQRLDNIKGKCTPCPSGFVIASTGFSCTKIINDPLPNNTESVTTLISPQPTPSADQQIKDLKARVAKLEAQKSITPKEEPKKDIQINSDVSSGPSIPLQKISWWRKIINYLFK